MELELGSTLADVSDFTLKNLASCSKYAYNSRLTELAALILSLIRLLIDRGRRSDDHSLRAHNHMFHDAAENCDRT